MSLSTLRDLLHLKVSSRSPPLLPMGLLSAASWPHCGWHDVYRQCRSAAHRFDNFGGEDAKQLVVITPAIMGAVYFREAADVINAAAGSPPDREKMMEIMRRHGMTVTAPPPTK